MLRSYQVFLFALIGLFIIVSPVMYHVYKSRVAHVDFVGDLHHIKPIQLQKAVKSLQGQSFINPHYDHFLNEVAQIPWVDQLAWNHLWPNTLQVHLSERVPLLRWGPDHMIDRSGVLFASGDNSKFNNLPYLHATDDVDYKIVYRLYFLLADYLKQYHSALTALNYDALHGWRISLSNHATVILGRRLLWVRLDRFFHYWPQVHKKPGSRYGVDMRYAHGFSAYLLSTGS